MEVQTNQIVCRCGSVDDYRIIDKANNKMAYCNDCNAFIKNIPYKDPAFYFGKYKGHLIKTIEDLNYLEWALGNR
jgi:predicted amidophosphoribosyltransferase